MSGWFGKRFVSEKFRAYLKSNYHSFIRYRYLKTEAKLFIQVPIMDGLERYLLMKNLEFLDIEPLPLSFDLDS